MAKSSTFVATLKFIDSFTPGFAKAIRTAERESKVLQNQMRAMSNLGSSLSNLGRNLTIGLTAPIVGLGTKAVQSAMSYESSINKIMTLQRKFASNGTIDLNDPQSVNKFANATKESITSLSNTYGVAQTELAQSYYLLASAFNDTTHMEKAMNVATQMSIAGNVDAASSARILATAYNAYGKTLGETDETIEKIGDVLAATVNFGFTEFPELADSMGRVFSTAAQMGISLEDVASSMAVITSTGISTAEAVTYFNNAIRQATKNGDRQLFTDDNFIQYLDSIKDSMPEIEQVLTKFKNLRAASGMTAMLGNTDLYKVYHNEMSNANGTLKEMFENMRSTSSRNFQVTMTRLNNILEKFGERILPTVNKYLEKFSAWLDGIRIDDTTIDNWLSYAKVVAALGPALMIVGNGMKLIATWKSAAAIIKGLNGAAISGAQTTIESTLKNSMTGGSAVKASAASAAGGAGGALSVAGNMGIVAMGVEAGRQMFGAFVNQINENKLINDNKDNAKILADKYRAIANEGAGIDMGAGADPRYQIMFNKKADRYEKIGNNASGTARWKGGLTTINERGGELVNLPSGAKILPANQSAIQGITINIPKLAETITFRNENDIDIFTDMIADKLVKVVANS